MISVLLIDCKASANQRLLEARAHATALEKQAEEGKAREAQLRLQNKVTCSSILTIALSI